VLRGPAFGLVGASDAMESVRRQIAQVADLDVPVLIRGETGTGKEMVARAIAAGSGRAEPFVAVNMAAVPPSTAAAELFGHERGAFTGATETRPGYFGEADGGTLFLDEIGATPPDVQPMLLRTLETWEVRPLGGRKARKVRVRLVTATDADLDAAVKRGQFSEPLLHRLSGYQIALPPLRARREDIGPLFLHFLEQELATTSELDRLEPREPTLRPWLGARDAARLFGGTWPGNVRRLRNVARQLVISSRGRPFAEIDMTLRDLVTASTVATTTVTPPRSVRQGRVTDEEIWDALVTHDFNHAAAAEALGIHRSTLYERLEANPQGLRTAAQLTDDEILRAFERHGKDITAMARELHCSPKPLKSRLTAALKSRPKGGQ
jgi:two-component system nitrogen regulation response regulator GlnG